MSRSRVAANHARMLRAIADRVEAEDTPLPPSAIETLERLMPPEGLERGDGATQVGALGLLDPQERALEKQRSRDEDARALASGEKTREQLRRENGIFAFPRVRVSLRGAKPLE